MTIVSYNISACTQAKIDHVLGMGADLYVIPECANRKYIVLPDGYGMLWTGDDDIPRKGLGVIWNTRYSVRLAEEFQKIRHHLPLIVEGEGVQIFILACWPTMGHEQKTYPQLLLEAIEAYSSCLDRFPSLAIGDFNCYIGQSGVRQGAATFEDCIQAFNTHCMSSIYHDQTGEAFGNESQPTFFWRFKENSPFFLDYAFSNLTSLSLEIGQWEKELSDHRPLIVRI